MKDGRPTGGHLVCECGKSANHWEGNKGYCCKCWVNAGNAPADWHEDCLRAEKNKERRENKGSIKIAFSLDEIEEIQSMTAELIEEIYDDPLACCDYEEKEVVKRLLILSKICEKIGINYLEIVKRRSEYEQERVREITEKVATKILKEGSNDRK